MSGNVWLHILTVNQQYESLLELILRIYFTTEVCPLCLWNYLAVISMRSFC